MGLGRLSSGEGVAAMVNFCHPAFQCQELAPPHSSLFTEFWAPLTAGWTGAIYRGDPEVGRARVKDNSEVLWWRANGDGAEILHLWSKEKGRKLEVQRAFPGTGA